MKKSEMQESVIIFGACGRIGKVLVEAFSKRGNTWVVAVDISHERLADIELVRGEKHVLDISSAESITQLFEYLMNEGRVPKYAVNTSYPIGRNYGRDFFEVEYDDFCDNISKHMGAYFVVMQQCARFATTHDVEFSLVNLSSVYGVIAPRLDVYNGTDMTMPIEYAAIKSGIQHMQQFLTSYTKGTQFRVNSISPGGIFDNQPSEFLQNYREYSRTKGMLDAEDLVGMVLCLLSPASRFICGQNIVIDDGFSIGGRHRKPN